MTDIEEFATRALTMPEDFAIIRGDGTAYKTHGSVFAVHRDSDILSQSNWHAFCQELGITYHGLKAAAEGETDNVYIMGNGHWLVGSVDTLMVKVYHVEGAIEDGIAEIEEVYTPEFIKAWELHKALESYPVLDDEDFSRREYEDLIETLVLCYDVPADLSHECREYLDISTSDEIHYADRSLALWKLSYLPIEDAPFGYAEAHAAHLEVS